MGNFKDQMSMLFAVDMILVCSKANEGYRFFNSGWNTVPKFGTSEMNRSNAIWKSVLLSQRNVIFRSPSSIMLMNIEVLIEVIPAMSGPLSQRR